jgi:DNA-directed RNA polymerase subunit N (RpoN/RPB10)
MARCFRCGQLIAADKRHFRRRVRTGDRSRVVTAKQRTKETVTSFGMRVVCSSCARYLDLQRRGETAADNIKLILALASLVLVALARLLGL